MKQLVIVILLLASNFSQGITLDFSKVLGGTLNEESICVFNDHQGHYFLSGRFSGTVDFDFSNATANLIANGSTDIFFAKYDTLGNLVWVKQIGGALLDGAYSIKTDHNNDVILCGYFRGSNVDFDPGPSTYLISSNGDNGFDSGFGGDAFLAKFTSNGNFLWAFAVGGYYSHDGFTDFDVDDNNNIYVGGFMNVTSSTPIDIDPGIGVFDIATTSQGHGLIAKYSTNGNYLWGFTFGDYGIASGVFSLKRIPTDTSIVVTGHIKTTNKDFDPGPGTSYLTSQFSDIFLTKIKFGGSVEWVENFGGTNTAHWQDIGTDLSVDSSQCIYLSGFYTGNGANFNPMGNSYIQNAIGNADNFISKFDKHGKLIWFNNFGSVGSEGYIATERFNGTLFVTGSFSNTLDLDPSISTQIISSNGATDAFVAKFDTSGNYICGFSFGGIGAENANWITDANTENALLTAGYFNSSVMDVDPSSSNVSITSNGGYDDYYLKYSFESDSSINLVITDDTICANQTPMIFLSSNSSSLTPVNIVYSAGGNTYTANNIIPNTSFSLNGMYTSTTSVMINSISPSVTANCVSITYTFNSPIQVHVNTVPTLNTSASPSSLCFGQSTIITASGATQLSWNPSIQNGVPFIPVATTTYTVVGTSSNGCSSTSSVTVVVNPNPIVYALASPMNVCAGSPCSLTGSGALNYSWSGGVNNGIPFFPSSAGSYTVVGTDANGCSATSSVSITVSAPPVISTTAQPDSICVGGLTQLNASGAATYQWSGGIQNNVPFSPSSSSTYTVSGIDNNGCSATAIQAVYVYPSPVVSASAMPDSLCYGNQTVLLGSGASLYTWSGGIQNGVPFIPQTSGSYTVTGIDGNGCTASSSVYVNVFNHLPVGIINNQTTLCSGDSALLVGTGASSYSWLPASALDTTAGVSVWAYPVGGVTTFTVTGTDATGCTGTATTLLNTIPRINVVASKSNDIICGLQSAQLQAYGADNYLWSPAIGLSDPAIPNPVATIYQTTTYVVTGTSETCTDKDSVTITYFTGNHEFDLVPSAFSPNNDGLNDCLHVLHNVDLREFYFAIYNRWGQRVFETKNVNDCWDGNFNNEPAAVGTYYYFLRSNSPCGDNFVKGDVTLIR
ncbi:MAG: gliding motility-associated C-terminal domain-containing protein [Chitinophagaceae bacterium]|nr:gliding motility-associated C-terminal domain-containing protein [Chitinophagaceae bacterium]